MKHQPGTAAGPAPAAERVALVTGEQDGPS
jgi:hypothetical protein